MRATATIMLHATPTDWKIRQNRFRKHCWWIQCHCLICASFLYSCWCSADYQMVGLAELKKPLKYQFCVPWIELVKWHDGQNFFLPSSTRMPNTGMLHPTHLVIACLHISMLSSSWPKKFELMFQSSAEKNSLWSWFPSPNAPSLRMSSANSGFFKYSFTNSWEFFTKTSSKSYCKAYR